MRPAISEPQEITPGSKEEEKLVFSEQDIKRMNSKWEDAKFILKDTLYTRVYDKIKSEELNQFFEEKKSVLVNKMQEKRQKQKQKDD